MFGFLKINQDAKRDEVQEEFVARVANAAKDFVQAAGSAGATLDYPPPASTRSTRRSKPRTSAPCP